MSDKDASGRAVSSRELRNKNKVDYLRMHKGELPEQSDTEYDSAASQVCEIAAEQPSEE